MTHFMCGKNFTVEKIIHSLNYYCVNIKSYFETHVEMESLETLLRIWSEFPSTKGWRAREHTSLSKVVD